MISQKALLPTMATGVATKASATGIPSPRFTVINEGSNDMLVAFAEDDATYTAVVSGAAGAGQLTAVRKIPGGTTYNFGNQFKAEIHSELYILSRCWIQGVTGDVCRIDYESRYYS